MTQPLTRRQRRMLARILSAAGLLLILWLLSQTVPMPVPVRAALYLLPYGVAGWDVLFRAARNIRNGQAFDENFLMALATVGAFATGEYAEAVFVMVFYQIGEWFQDYAVGRSRQSIAALMDIRPDTANVVQPDGTVEEQDPEDVEAGTEILIKPGERVPLDGVVLEGSSALDTAALTGESLPRDVSPGDSVVSGCVNLSGLLRVRTTKSGEESTVSRILELVENAGEKKAVSEQFITRFARYYTPCVVLAATALAVVPPLFTGHWGTWFHRALIFLVVSCPCALVISVPLSFFGGIGGASKQGILVKGSVYLEALARAETVVFDKTGTLTQGRFTVTEAEGAGKSDGTEGAEGFSGTEVLELAALAESWSDHPIALSLRAAWEKQAARRSSGKEAGTAVPPDVTAVPPDSTAVPPDSTAVSLDGAAVPPDGAALSPDSTAIPTDVTDVEELAGHGVRATVRGRRVCVGNRRLLDGLDVPASEGVCVYVSVDGRYAGRVRLEDLLKPDARAAIADLRRCGVRRTVMLTGDSAAAAQTAAREAGVDAVYAELLPADKVDLLETLLKEKRPGGTVVFVGDGLNDAPVLARADVGVAMGGLGSDAAIEAADVVLMDDRPSKLAAAVRIARKTVGIVRQNIVFALAVKFLVLVLAALGHAPMWAAVFADVGVAFLAILNAMRCLQVENLA